MQPNSNMTERAIMPGSSSETFFRERDPVGGVSKRCLDIGLVLLALPIFLPVILVLIAMVRASGPGSAFFGHRRIGFGGAEFRCWKFRTMVHDGDAVLAEHFRANPAAEAVWKDKRKLEDDPRVTRIGAWLRKLSLDELPQLWNVLTGEMSLVGPRPVVLDELDYYGASAKYYLAARPGLTGLWQISGRSDTTYAERVHLDATYVQDWSLGLDMRTVLMTVPAVIQSRGAC